MLWYSYATAISMDHSWSPSEPRLIVPDNLLSNGKMLFDQFDVNRSNTSRIGSRSEPA